MIPVIDVSRIIGWGKTAVADVIKWVALRALLIALISTLVPLAIYHGWLLIQEQLITYMSSQMTGDFWSGTMVDLTGLAGWLSGLFRFQACFALLASAMTFKFVLGFFHK